MTVPFSWKLDRLLSHDEGLAYSTLHTRVTCRVGCSPKPSSPKPAQSGVGKDCPKPSTSGSGCRFDNYSSPFLSCRHLSGLSGHQGPRGGSRHQGANLRPPPSPKIQAKADYVGVVVWWFWGFGVWRRVQGYTMCWTHFQGGQLPSYTYTYIFIHIYITYLYMYMYLWLCLYTYTHQYLYLFVSTSIYLCLYLYLYLYLYLQLYLHHSISEIYICMYLSVCVKMYI